MKYLGSERSITQDYITHGGAEDYSGVHKSEIKINGKGNSALTYPIGLITIDELEMAGNNWSESNTNYYLHTGAYYWAGSPVEFSGGYFASGFFVDGDGDLNYVNVDYSNGVRGVVSLSSESKLLGSGTYNDVYTVN